MIKSYIDFLNIDFKKNIVITVIGSGGKTTIIEELSKEIYKKGKTVLITTTTKIYIPSHNNAVTILEPEILKKIKLNKNEIIYGASMVDSNNKLHGYSEKDLNDIKNNNSIDVIIIEGDGSMGKPIKAYKDHEPVIPTFTDILIAVVGLNSLGKDINESNVHRAKEFISIVKKEMDQKIDCKDIISIITDREGYFKYKCNFNFLIFNRLTQANKEIYEYIKNEIFQKTNFIEKIGARGEIE
jgi:probable selenium-dependent hydroxylase accessory protein YqeC